MSYKRRSPKGRVDVRGCGGGCLNMDLGEYIDRNLDGL